MKSAIDQRIARCGLALIFAGGGLAAQAPCVSESVPTFRVRRLTTPGAIKIGDRSLADWDAALLVRQIGPSEATSNQWKAIRGVAPKPVNAKDIAIKLFMTWDETNWYIGIDIEDDVILAMPSTSPYPYSGDCFELFFAGKHTSSKLDIHNHVEQPTANQAAFFQLVLPPIIPQDVSVQLPDWRTDSAFRNKVLKLGFASSAWIEGARWRAEVRIPLSAFEDAVLKSIRSGEPLKLGFDYLDYDTRRAERTAADNYGFRPDHAFAFGPEERHVNTPACMPAVVFVDSPAVAHMNADPSTQMPLTLARRTTSHQGQPEAELALTRQTLRISRTGMIRRDAEEGCGASLPLGGRGQQINGVSYCETGDRLLLLYYSNEPGSLYPHTTISHMAAVRTSDCSSIWYQKLHGPAMVLGWDAIVEDRAVYICGQHRLAKIDMDTGKSDWSYEIGGDDVFRCSFDGNTVKRVHRRGVGPIVDKLSGSLLRQWE